MKTKRKNIFKSLLALTLALIMVLGVAPISELAGVDWASLFAPKAEALSADYNVGDIVKLGSYPQGRVTDSTLISALNKIAKTWTSYDYYSGNDTVGSMTKGDWMKYYDFTYNGVKYRAVTFSQYRPYYTHTSLSSGELHQKYNGYYTNNVYYFKFEPLKWRVLDPATGLVLCENIVDSQAYSNTVYEYGTDKNGTAYWNDSAHTHYANDYATSSIRKWLNNDFYNTAFSAAEKKSILTTTLDNRAYSTDHSEYDSETTKDKIFLLSYSDINNAAYGLSSRSNRLSKGSDYAKSQGLYVDSDGQSSMRLRSAGHDSYHTSRVSHDGDLNHYIKNDINFTPDGVRPALRTNFAVDIYNLGDETYSFENFGDSDSPYGHCFGMSMTSSGYYIGVLDRKLIGKDTSKSLHSFSREEAKKPICYYQDIQGSYSAGAIVAGGSVYLTGRGNIRADWNEVVNYVKDHNYDNKGSLQVSLTKGNSGHAINFLYYKEVNGQQRIYVYDNNYPDVEIYFYQGSDGKVYETPKSTYGNTWIDCIALRDVATYFELAKTYKASRCIYAATGTVDVKDYVCKSQMEGTLGGVEYTMYELSDDAETTVVVPLTDNATFSYLNNDYSFGEINDETYGVLTLAQSGDSATGDKADFNIANEPVKATGITLASPTSPIPVGGSYQLVAAAQPDGASLPDLVWTSSDPSVASVDENGLVKALSVGTATISVTDSESKFSAEVEINTVQVIDFGEGPTIKVGEKLIYTPVIQEDYVDYHYKWSSSDPSVVTVDPDEGELTGIKKGTATVTMTLVDDDGNVVASADFTVTVKSDSIFKKILNVITAPFRAIINLFKKLFGK